MEGPRIGLRRISQLPHLRGRFCSLTAVARPPNATRVQRALLLAIALVPALGGCTRWIALDSDRYQPSFTQDLSAYAGHSVVLPDVIDADPATYEQDFTDAERTTWYSSSAYYEAMESYLWYVFAKALETIGMTVGDDPAAPRLQFAMVSLSEATYRFRVDVTRSGRLVLRKEYEASLPVLRGAERTDEALERRIDRMVDELVQTVFTDPEFEQALLGTPKPVR